MFYYTTNPSFVARYVGDKEDQGWSPPKKIYREAEKYYAPKNDSDGMWCPDCMKDGVYSWIGVIDVLNGERWFGCCVKHRGKRYRKIDGGR